MPLRSSPARRTGAARGGTDRTDAADPRCDPHRPRRTGAAAGRVHAVAGGPPVAILTGPEGPVLRLVGQAWDATSGGLRSSPAPKDRCCPVGPHTGGVSVPPVA